MTRIKICGITRLEDADLCAELKLDAVGLVFHAASPRSVTIERARAIRASLPPEISLVGVFVDENEEVIRDVYESCGLDLVQLHGREDASFCSDLGLPYIKALPFSTDLGIMEMLADYPRADAFLLDSVANGQFGGTGRSINFSAFPHDTNRKLFLAGGLGVRNIREAVMVASPDGVDASSKLEFAPGIKDHALVSNFVRIVRETDQDVEGSGTSALSM